MGTVSLQQKKQDIRGYLLGREHIALFGHINPDGDAIGSMLGLGTALEAKGKRVEYFTPTSATIAHHIFPKSKKIHTSFASDISFDCLVFVDFNDLKRLGELYDSHQSLFDTTPIVVIDHHQGEPDFAFDFWQDKDSVSCCELIFELLECCDPSLITAEIATYLYYGHTTDSGNFLYDTDHLRAFHTAYHLLQKGADKDLVVSEVFYRKTVGDLSLLQVVLARMHQADNILRSWFDENDLSSFGVERENAKEALHLMTKVHTHQVAILFHKEQDNTIKAHFRSQGAVDVSAIARAFGGGGHVCASGATFTGLSCEKIVAQVSDYLSSTG